MAKKRVYEFAKEHNISSKALIEKAKEHGMDLKSLSSIDDHQEKQLMQLLPHDNNTDKKPVSHATHHIDSKNGKMKISRRAIRPQTNNTQNNMKKNEHKSFNDKRNYNQNNRRNNNNRSFRNNNQARSHEEQSTHRMSAMERAQQLKQAQNAAQQRAVTRELRYRDRQQNRNNEQRNEHNKSTRPTNNKRKFNNNNATRPQRVQHNSNNHYNRNNHVTIPAAPVTAPQPVKNDSRDHNMRRNSSYDYQQRPKFKKKNKKGRKQERAAEVAAKKAVPQRKERPLPDVLLYTEGMNAQDLGKVLHREPAEIVKKLFMLGIMVNQNKSLDDDTIELLATDYGIEAKKKEEKDISDLDKIFDAEMHNTDHLVARPPVVTVMGHVDHGKTTLLDKLRNSHVTAGEAGGITQHIGAYQVKLDGRIITFLDTPGHAAFTNMRARGADITDIVVLVVAADDGVMPQTIEAINHAKAAKAPIIVAINKIDKPGANPNHVMEQLSEYELIPEDWGGDTIFVNISAKKGTNIDELLQMILLEADMLELKADPDQKAVGTVVEARLDKGKGPVATLLVQQGTLHVGDPIVVGNTFGRVRVMTNGHGRRVKEALPSAPVEITGLNDVPQSADKFVVFDDEKSARAAGEARAKQALLAERNHAKHVTLDNLFETMKEGELKEVNVIIKADVQGSVEALEGSLQKINVKGVRVNIIHAAVGAINESDVTLASASNAIIVGFNVRPTPMAKQQAETDHVDIRLHRVIYNVIEEIEEAMKGMLEPEYTEKVIGNLTVRETYKASKVGTIAGCMVDSGKITRDSKVRLIRNGIVIYEGELGSLKRFKDDVKEVQKGFECGLTIANYNDIKVDDQIEAYVMEEVPVK
ncbi:MAG: translation initiation factor IF-2 [Candidatus Paralactobacillus gallistercoris]|uniref:Translation initiation factor IF-2 n=1 Tax=Candidatus Paralactobacillus gallistercoris TaxID=2838724 RepID=A0A948TJA3_9LACO|nr:translation initiation factor IF-2 [Candidatus Paralactobacillus gallistercoris]